MLDVAPQIVNKRKTGVSNNGSIIVKADHSQIVLNDSERESKGLSSSPYLFFSLWTHNQSSAGSDKS